MDVNILIEKSSDDSQGHKSPSVTDTLNGTNCQRISAMTPD